MSNKIKTLKKFIAEAQHIEPKLIRAVVANLDGWESFIDDAPNIIKHGIDCGFGDFIYYVDTIKFWRKNRKEIVALAEQQANDFDADVISMVQQFNCLVDRSTRKPDYTTSEIAQALYGRYNDDFDYIYNTLAWYAAEETARAYCDLLEC